MKKLAIVLSVAVLPLLAVQAPAEAYTRGGDIYVMVAVDGNNCATAEWPKGNQLTFCDRDSTTQTNVQPGDRFGVKVRSYSGFRVGCAVMDVESGETLIERYADGNETANCMMRAE